MTALLGLWPEMQDTCTSLGLMLSIVLFMGLARVVTRQQLNGPMAHAFVLEFLATFQLCFCTHDCRAFILQVRRWRLGNRRWLGHGQAAGLESCPCNL